MEPQKVALPPARKRIEEPAHLTTADSSRSRPPKDLGGPSWPVVPTEVPVAQ